MQHLQPNTTLQGGKYRIERVLGQGGFGNTYMAKNTVFDDLVAIKEFFIQGVNDRDENSGSITIGIESNIPQFEEQREKFKKEAKRLWKLKNEHIVKVHDLFDENGTAYYVMDFIDGESLAEKMKRTGSSLSESEVKNVLLQLLNALKVVHQNEIWHLDLKPGNIMIDKSGNAYLIDFGASKQLRANGSMTTSTALCYTPGYAPNEQIGQMYDRFGPWTDIYALGATVYNLLTNKKPPMAIDIEEDGEKAFNFPLYISEEMRKLVVWMMQPKRKARPQNVAEIISKMSDSKQSVQKAAEQGHEDAKKALQYIKQQTSQNSSYTNNLSGDESTIIDRGGHKTTKVTQPYSASTTIFDEEDKNKKELEAKQSKAHNIFYYTDFAVTFPITLMTWFIVAYIVEDSELGEWLYTFYRPEEKVFLGLSWSVIIRAVIILITYFVVSIITGIIGYVIWHKKD